MDLGMNKRQAYAIIARQFRQGNAIKNGIAVEYATKKAPSRNAFLAAVKATGGELWSHRDTSYTKGPGGRWVILYKVTAFIPDQDIPGLDYLPGA